ncbi:hypothetical protein FRB97_004493 [Tulasnella sp. 331]|nr:hypothetical protein FRB97_004493 [Tulasnella sp. 331]
MLSIFTSPVPESGQAKKPSAKTLLFWRKKPSVSSGNKENETTSQGAINFQPSQSVSKKPSSLISTKTRTKKQNLAEAERLPQDETHGTYIGERPTFVAPFVKDNSAVKPLEISTRMRVNCPVQTTIPVVSHKTELSALQRPHETCGSKPVRSQTKIGGRIVPVSRQPSSTFKPALQHLRSLASTQQSFQIAAVAKPRPRVKVPVPPECIMDRSDRPKRASWVDEQTFIDRYVEARRIEEHRAVQPKPVQPIPYGMKLVVVTRPTSASWIGYGFAFVPDERKHVDRPVSLVDEDDIPLATLKAQRFGGSALAVPARNGCTTSQSIENDDEDIPLATLQALIRQQLDDEDTPLATIQARLRANGVHPLASKDGRITRRHAIKRKAGDCDKGHHRRKAKQSSQARDSQIGYGAVKQGRGMAERYLPQRR